MYITLIANIDIRPKPMLSHSSPSHRIANLVSKFFISPRYMRATTCRPFSFRPWA